MPGVTASYSSQRLQPASLGVWLLPLVLILLLAGVATAEQPWHPNHISLAEVEYNQQSGNFEVAMCVWPTDLEQVLQRQQGRLVDLQKEPAADLDSMIAKYIDAKFRIRPRQKSTLLVKTSPAKPTAAEEPAKPSDSKSKSTAGEAENERSGLTIRWVGHQASLKQVWLFFEVPGATAQHDWTIENRVFFELNDDQINQIQWTRGEDVKTLVCEPNDPRQAMTTDVK